VKKKKPKFTIKKQHLIQSSLQGLDRMMELQARVPIMRLADDRNQNGRVVGAHRQPDVNDNQRRR
jgi:hypothetical protein